MCGVFVGGPTEEDGVGVTTTRAFMERLLKFCPGCEHQGLMKNRKPSYRTESEDPNHVLIQWI